MKFDFNALYQFLVQLYNAIMAFFTSLGVGGDTEDEA